MLLFRIDLQSDYVCGGCSTSANSTSAKFDFGQLAEVQLAEVQLAEVELGRSRIGPKSKLGRSRTDGVCSFSSVFCMILFSAVFPSSSHSLLSRLALHLLFVLLSVFVPKNLCPEPKNP